jgi:uncharacterized repeat protein (TIGR01451 family)
MTIPGVFHLDPKTITACQDATVNKSLPRRAAMRSKQEEELLRRARKLVDLGDQLKSIHRPRWCLLRQRRTTPGASGVAAARGDQDGESRAVRAGDTVRLTIRVTNRSRVEARRVRVCDSLPAGLVIVRSTPGGRVSRGDHCWTLRRLGARSTRAFRVAVRALPGAAGRKVNRAYATAAGVRATARASRQVRVLPEQAPGGSVTG